MTSMVIKEGGEYRSRDGRYMKVVSIGDDFAVTADRNGTPIAVVPLEPEHESATDLVEEYVTDADAKLQKMFNRVLSWDGSEPALAVLMEARALATEVLYDQPQTEG